VAKLIPIIAEAPAESRTRAAWLERLLAAHEADQIPYIERLADDWGDLCASMECAAAWADRLIGITGLALSPDKSVRGYFHGTSACLSALYRAERYQEIVDLLGGAEIWPYKRWAVKALAAMGGKSEAMRYAESCRHRGWATRPIDATDWWPIALGRISAPSEPLPANIHTRADPRFCTTSYGRRLGKRVNGSQPRKRKVSTTRRWRSPLRRRVIRGRSPRCPRPRWRTTRLRH